MAERLGVALNEARLLDMRVPKDPPASVELKFEVNTRSQRGPARTEIASVELSAVGRLAASLRMGLWNDENAEVIPLGLDDLSETVRSFGGQPIYGWQFVDDDPRPWLRDGRVSLDVSFPGGSLDHTIEVFQEDASDRILEVRIWFGAIRVKNADGAYRDLEDFLASGRRWWDALFGNDTKA